MKKTNLIKRTIAAAVAAAMTVTVFVLPAAAEGEANSKTLAAPAADDALEKAEAFYSASGILSVPSGASLDVTSVSRGKFASMLGEITGIASAGAAETVQDDDGWLWLGDSKKSEGSVESTGFSDVPSDHKYAKEIKKAAEYGYMNGGGDGKFLPNERITAVECFAALTRILNADFLTASGSYETRYVRLAKKLGLTKNLSVTDYSKTISARDVYVLLFNALFTEIYSLKTIGSSVEYAQTDGYYLASVYFKIYKETGIFEENQRTSLESPTGCGEGYVTIGSTKYKTDSESWDSLLGYNTEVYYKQERESEKSIVYVTKYQNKEKTVDSDDIETFSKPDFLYLDKNEKKQTIRLKGDEDVIYNGKAIGSWTVDIFKPDCGSVTFIDNDSNGGYEVIIIDSRQVVFTDAVDKLNEVFTDKNSGKSFNLYKKEYAVYDSKGAETDFDALSEKTVLEVRQTIEGQGEEWTEVYICDNKKVGEVTLTDGEYVYIDGEKTEISDICKEKFEPGDYGVFHLTSAGKIAEFEKSEKTYSTYGYIVSAARIEGSFEPEFKIKLFTTKSEFITCTFAEKVRVNGNVIKKDKAYDALCKDGEPVNQLIEFRQNDKGELSEFNTAGGTEDGFVKGASVSGTCRTVTRAFVGARYSAYYDSDTVVMYVPDTDMSNEDLYSVEKTFTNDYSYSFVSSYYPDKDSVVADVLIKTVSDDAGSKISDQTTPPMIVSEVGTSYINDEVYTYVSGYENGSLVTKKTADDKVSRTLETLKKGDIIRCQNNISGNIKACVKIYDITTRSFVDTANPVSPSSGNMISQFTLLHGEAWARASESKIIKVMPYVYKKVGEGIQKTEGTDEATLYNYDGSGFTTILVDTGARDINITKVNSNDVMTRDKLLKGDELLVHTIWSDPKVMIIIR